MIQKKRRDKKTETEMAITKLNKSLNSDTINQEERLEEKRKLIEIESILEKMEKHLAKGTSVRSRQEWDMNAEGQGKILLKCEEK